MLVGPSPAWEAVELTLGGCLHLPVRGPRPYRFGSEIVVAPGQMSGHLLLSPDADCLPFLTKASTCDHFEILDRQAVLSCPRIMDR